METGILSPVDIAVSGLRAESLRMKVISNNIANSNTTHTAAGGPFCRQDVLLRTNENVLSGVNISDVIDDMSTNFQQVFKPGHPDADEKGFVSMPNIQLPVEMMSLVAASRAYQANAAVLKRYQEMVDLTVELLK